MYWLSWSVYFDSAMIRWSHLSDPKNVRFARIRLKETFGSWYFFCRGDCASECGSKHTLLTSDFQLHGSLSFPLPSLSVPAGEGQHRQGHGVDDTRALASLSVALHLAVRLGAATLWLLPPELSPHRRDTSSIPIKVASHIARPSPSTASPGGHGQKQPVLTSRANQGGFSAAARLNTPFVSWTLHLYFTKIWNQ